MMGTVCQLGRFKFMMSLLNVQFLPILIILKECAYSVQRDASLVKIVITVLHAALSFNTILKLLNVLNFVEMEEGLSLNVTMETMKTEMVVLEIAGFKLVISVMEETQTDLTVANLTAQEK